MTHIAWVVQQRCKVPIGIKKEGLERQGQRFYVLLMYFERLGAVKAVEDCRQLQYIEEGLNKPVTSNESK